MYNKFINDRKNNKVNLIFFYFKIETFLKHTYIFCWWNNYNLDIPSLNHDDLSNIFQKKRF